MFYFQESMLESEFLLHQRMTFTVTANFKTDIYISWLEFLLLHFTIFFVLTEELSMSLPSDKIGVFTKKLGHSENECSL